MTTEYEILDLRLSKVEAKLFEGANLNIDDELKKLTARQQAEKITSQEHKEHHIGDKSKKVLKQEIISHKQNYEETFSKHEKSQWNKKLVELETELSQF